MKKSFMIRVISMCLAVAMVILMIPCTVIATDEGERHYNTGDYTPFLISSSNGETVYSAYTADMLYSFYSAAKAAIPDTVKDHLTSISGFEFGEYTPNNTMVVHPDMMASCGMIVCTLNFKVPDNSAKGYKVLHILMVVFQGTNKNPHDNAADLATDLISKELVSETGSSYHGGFFAAASNHYNILLSAGKAFSLDSDGSEIITFKEYLNRMSRDYEDEEYTLISTGHSLGAAVSNIFVSDFVNPQLGKKAVDRAVAYTFATPLTCREATKYSNAVNNVFNIINQNDWVPKVGYGVTNSKQIKAALLGAEATILAPLILPEVFDAFMSTGARQGKDLVVRTIKYKNSSVFSMSNHHFGNYYSIYQYINDNILDYTDQFVLYENHDSQTNGYQRILYSNGTLILSGNGVLKGDWSDHTSVQFSSIENKCTALIFDRECRLTEIGDYAFSGMSQIKSELQFPDTLIIIGKYAFFRCGIRGDLIIPAQMQKIGNHAFYNCSSLSTIDVRAAENLTWGYGAFAGCVGKHGLLLPEVMTPVIDPFGQYYVEDQNGAYLIEIKNKEVGNTVLPGDKLFIARLDDERLIQRPYYDFHYYLTTGNTDTFENVKKTAVKSIEGVASVDEMGCITIEPDCKGGSEFSVIILDDIKGAPDFDSYDVASSRTVHFTVKAASLYFAGGLGMEERPYLIKNSDQLKKIKDDLSAYYKLIGDINFENKSLSPLGDLSGGLDGNGYKVCNFKMSEDSNTGLFSNLNRNAFVKNLIIDSASISSGHNGSTYLYSGGICANNYGIIENCRVSNTSIYAGRDVDWSNKSCLYSIVGGITGQNNGTIKQCDVVNCSQIKASSDTIKDTSPAKCYSYSGGLAGINDGNVSKCSSLNNTIKGYAYSKDSSLFDNKGEAQTYCGGLVANNRGTVESCNISGNKLDADTRGDGGEGTDVEKEGDYCAIGNKEIRCTTKNTVSTSAITNITIEKPICKTHYNIGDSINLYGLVIRDNMDSLVEGYSIYGFDSNKSGIQKVNVSYTTGYGTCTTNFEVTVENILPETVIIKPKKEQVTVGPNNSDYTGGTGTEEDPYLIKTIDQFLRITEIRAESKTVKDTSPAKCYAYSGGLVGINTGSLRECSSVNNKISGYTYSVDNNVAFTDWNEGEAQTYCAGLVAENDDCVEKCYIFKNTVEAKAEGDGGEGTDIEKQEAYCCIGSCIDCSERYVLSTSNCTDSTRNYLYSDDSIPSEPNDTQFALNMEFSPENFTAVVYYNNGTVEMFDSLSGTDSNTVQFTPFTYQANEFGWHTIVVNYHYAYITTEGKVAASPSVSVTTAVKIVCDHQTTVVENAVEPTSTTYGYSGDTICAICHALIEEGELLDKLPSTHEHAFGNWTAHDDKQHMRTCSCGETEYADHIEVTVKGKAATCTETGLTEGKKCSVCGVVTVAQQTIPAKGHTEVTVKGKEPTCTATGLTDGKKCSVCGVVTVAQKTIPAMGHAWDAGVITTNPTTTTEGVRTFTCTVCKATKTEPIPKIDPTAFSISGSSVTVTAGKTIRVPLTVKNNPGFTYVKLGLTFDAAQFRNVKVTNGEMVSSMTSGKFYVWSSDTNITGDGVLGYVEFTVDENLPDGIYTIGINGYEVSDYDENDVAFYTEDITVEVVSYEYGDVNGDQVIDGKDVTRLRKYLANYDEETDVGDPSIEITSGADVTGDGNIDGKDLTRLLKYLANLDPDTGTSTVVLGPAK